MGIRSISLYFMHCRMITLKLSEVINKLNYCFMFVFCLNTDVNNYMNGLNISLILTNVVNLWNMYEYIFMCMEHLHHIKSRTKLI